MIMDTLMNGFSKAKTVSLTEKVHDQILEMIIKSKSDEAAVLNEKRLVELLGVSKATVREALVMLCSEDVLRNIPRYGYVVVQIKEQDRRDLIKMRILLEQEALKKSFCGQEIGEMQLEQLEKQITSAASKQNVDVWTVWEDNEEFHMLLASFADDRILMKFLSDCMKMQKRVYAQTIWNSSSSMTDSVTSTPHHAIFKELQAGNLEGALALLEQDVTGM